MDDRPLLAIDGDSLAHRAYHALPKSIQGALVGFSNFVLRLWDAEEPRAVLVGWDTLDSPTYRHEALPGYQSGRQFDRSLERVFGGVAIPSAEFELTEVRVRGATIRVQVNRFLEFGDCAVQVLETGE